MNEPTFVPVPASSRYLCEDVVDPARWVQCGARATPRARVRDPRRGSTWWAHACSPEHARGVAGQQAGLGYEFPEFKED